MTRTFIAVELDAEAREELRRDIDRLRVVLPGVRFVAPASLHLTLAFFGDLGDARLAEATAAAEEAAVESSPFTLRLGGIGTFGPPQAPRVIWAGVAGDVSALVALQSRLMRAVSAHGFRPEDRPFAPHLTLARLKKPLDTAQAAALQTLATTSQHEDGTPLPVESLAVMKSELLRSGARYTRLRAFPLAGRRAS